MKFTLATKPLQNAIDLGIIKENISKFSSGVNRFITEAVKMYGVGKYSLSFSCRAVEDGNLRFGVSYDDWQYANGYKEVFDVTTQWQDYTFDDVSRLKRKNI